MAAYPAWQRYKHLARDAAARIIEGVLSPGFCMRLAATDAGAVADFLPPKHWQQYYLGKRIVPPTVQGDFAPSSLVRGTASRLGWLGNQEDDGTGLPLDQLTAFGSWVIGRGLLVMSHWSLVDPNDFL